MILKRRVRILSPTLLLNQGAVFTCALDRFRLPGTPAAVATSRAMGFIEFSPDLFGTLSAVQSSIVGGKQLALVDPLKA